ncbi:hypothetical protein TWF694_007701 [Orbilia ellipsospora]|uniref:Uncharacterized protein n=1 Tax=Orbilia ellipsospora TaxID=2528407 RepID=A0AAV9XK78_9PEZI
MVGPVPKFDYAAAKAALYADFPHLFWQRQIPQSSMSYGPAIGPGWYPIIRELCVRITKAIDVEDLTDPKATKWGFAQIKEKYGELRIYGPRDGEGGPIYEAYEWAEEEASKTCEVCGRAGDMQVSSRGWYATTCQPCADENNNSD